MGLNLSTTDLGCISNIEVVQQLVDISDKFVLDIGCGDMTVSRQLAQGGAKVLGIDPDSIQAQLNRELAPFPNLEFSEAAAEKLPVENDSADGVVFSYSLHHIPESLYPEVFKEVVRVLRPDGFLYVIEPMDCPLNEVMKHFHDEDAERLAAQTALQELAVPAFESHERVTYHSVSKYESWDEFATRFASRTFNAGYTESDVRHPNVKAAFERLGAPDFEFIAPKQVSCFRRIRLA